jgi:uncharacterized protein with NRDE domain
MCVLALAWQAHPRWHLVLAGNRDELHSRPAAALDRWADPAGIIAGRDLVSDGTWLGVAEHGRLAVVTNLRGFGAPDPAKMSRGRLVADLLTGKGGYADVVDAALDDFNPFNLIVADREQAHFLSNRPENTRSRLAHGLYGLSNGALDELWPKTMRLKAHLLDWLIAGTVPLDALFEGLREETIPDVGLHIAGPSDVPQEPRLSSIFINDPVYGTRCSTIVAIDRAGRGTVLERRYGADTSVIGTTELTFDWVP